MKRVTEFLRNETVGGALLLVAACLALVWANLDRAGYFSLRDFHLGVESFDLSLGHWAADGLLAIFFFVAGLELKNEFLNGSLRDRKKAVVPVAAAIGGMVVPALIYVGFNSGLETLSGWGVPMATDIAFALAVLAVAGRNLPIEFRAFLLTLAVVDDLGAIIVIAVFYTASINLWALLVAALGLAVFGAMQSRKVAGWYLYLPLALLIWGAVYLSGIHATVAGVAMGLLMNLAKSDKVLHVVHPISAGVAVPIFAFFTAGVFIGQLDPATLTSPLALGIILGLVLGKPTGILIAVWLVTTFTKARLSSKLAWFDLIALGLLGGVGFTVSLLINELAFKGLEETASLGTVAVLIASTLAASLAAITLQFRKRAKRND